MYMDIRIKEILKEKGLSMKYLAENIGIAATSLSRSLSNNPTYDTLKKIAMALNVEVWELFTQSTEKEQNTVNCPYCGNRIKLSKDGAGYTDTPKPKPVANTAPTPPTKAPEQPAAKDEDTPSDNGPIL